MLLLSLLPLLASSGAVPWSVFRIDCVDAETGGGVPLVQLRTSGYISYYSDSGGVVAFDEPGMLGLAVFFTVLTDGYEVLGTPVNAPASDPGVLLRTVAGGRATVRLRRTQPAQRLFRLTGGGLYRDTVLAGGAPPVAEPLLGSAAVLGQDSVMAAPYKGEVFWFFGDTECPAGPRSTDCQHYGRFTTGATSPLPGATSPAGGATPPSLAYFASTNASDPGGMAPGGLPDAALLAQWNPTLDAPHGRAMLAGPGQPPLFNASTWLGSLTVLRDAASGEQRMYATYVCPDGHPDHLFGLARWDDGAQVFRPAAGAAGYKMRYSGAQAVQVQRPADGAWVYYASAFAMARAPATFGGLEDPRQYEYFTPCAAADAGGCDTRKMTAADWGWKRSDLDGRPGGVSYFGPAQEAAAIAAGRLRPQDARMQVTDAATQRPVGGVLSRGSVNWNAHRGAYVLVADRMDASGGAGDGTSRFGEIYLCEAPSLTGPWTECATVATHNRTGTSCYNPQQLPWLDEDGGRVLHFACTWTSMTSGAAGKADRACRFDDYGGVDCAVAVPRYEYNNLVFKLDVGKLAAEHGWTAGAAGAPTTTTTTTTTRNPER